MISDAVSRRYRPLLRLVDWLDGVNRSVGLVVAWLALAMVLVTFVVVVLRYVFDSGSIALQESVTYMYAILFMLGAAYTLQQDGHVRVDILYQRFSRRARAWVDLLGSLFLLTPVCVFLFIASWDYVADAWSIREGSREAGGLPGVWLLKDAAAGDAGVDAAARADLGAAQWIMHRRCQSCAARCRDNRVRPDGDGKPQPRGGSPAPVAELMPILLVLAVGVVLLLGYPVALSLGGTALAMAWLGEWLGYFDPPSSRRCRIGSMA